MDAIRRILAAERGYLLNEVTAIRGRRVTAAGWVVTNTRRPRLVRFIDQPAAERYFCDEVRRARDDTAPKSRSSVMGPSMRT